MAQGPVVDDQTLGERPNQVEGLHPFTADIMRVIMPENKMFPSVEKYRGTTDPIKHLQSFVDVIAVYSSEKLVWYRVLSLKLKDEALDWFHSLQPRTIDNFATLRKLFSQQCAANRMQGLTYTALVRMRQGKEDSLKVFMHRFNRTTRQVRNAYQRLVVNALTTTLRLGPFADYLYDNEPQTMAELQNKLASLIRIEEGRAYQRGQREETGPPTKCSHERRGEKRLFGGDGGGNGHRGMDNPKIPQYVHYTSLNAPRVRVMEEALRADLLTVARSPTPRGADERKHADIIRIWGIPQRIVSH